MNALTMLFASLVLAATVSFTNSDTATDDGGTAGCHVSQNEVPPPAPATEGTTDDDPNAVSIAD